MISAWSEIPGLFKPFYFYDNQIPRPHRPGLELIPPLASSQCYFHPSFYGSRRQPLPRAAGNATIFYCRFIVWANCFRPPVVSTNKATYLISFRKETAQLPKHVNLSSETSIDFRVREWTSEIKRNFTVVLLSTTPLNNVPPVTDYAPKMFDSRPDTDVANINDVDTTMSQYFLNSFLSIFFSLCVIE